MNSEREKLFEINLAIKKIKTTFLNSEHQILVKYKTVKNVSVKSFTLTNPYGYGLFVWEGMKLQWNCWACLLKNVEILSGKLGWSFRMVHYIHKATQRCEL